MEVKVIHEGNLEKCSSAEEHVKKEWKKRFFVFKHFPASSTKCLEYYKDSKNWRKQDAKGVLTLHPGYEVVKVFDSKRKFVFDVKTVERVFRLSAHSEDDLNKWILILEKENIVKSFVVEPVLDDCMVKIGTHSTCHLFIADTEIRLVSAQDGSQLISWPFTCLRRYMSSRGKFSLEAGRRAPTGEGKFTFITSQHDEIYKLLDNVIKTRAGSAGQNMITPSKPCHSPIPEPNNDRYDHLMSSPLKGCAPVHPNYNQNMTLSILKKKGDVSRSNDYASPYAHMKNQELRGEPDKMENSDLGASNQNSSIPNDDGYDLLNLNMATRKPSLPPTGENLEDTSIHGTDTYDSLDHQQGSIKKQGRLSFTTPFDSMSQETVQGDTYNVLAHIGTPVCSHTPSKDVEADEYSTLDRPPNRIEMPTNGPGLTKEVRADEYSTLNKGSLHTPLHQSRSFPIPPPKVPTTAIDPHLSQGFERNSVSSISSFGSSDVHFTSSSQDGQLSNDQEFYSHIDYDVASKQAIPVPQPKLKDGDDEKATSRNSIVSNLKASLIADGLTLNKINSNKLRLRRCSVETIEESDVYNQINDGPSQNQKKLQNKFARSPSVPSEPEDIYEDPELSFHQSKPKVSAIKPVKPRKKK